MNLIQAFVWNVGTYCMMRRENPISGGPTKGESIDAYRRGGPSRSVCLAAHVSGGLKSHSARGPGSISKGGGNASPAGVDGNFGGQGVRREVESEGLEENHRVVIDGSHPDDEPVGQRWAMVEPALWGRRRRVPVHRTRVCAGDTVGKRRV